MKKKQKIDLKCFFVKIKELLNNITKEDVIIFLIPFVVFCLYLFIYNPGILSYDSYNQLEQIDKGIYFNWHPFFHTFIEKLCLNVWNDTKSIGLFQIFVFCTIWCSICKYNRKKTWKSFCFQIIVTLLICLNPLNGIYSITLWKDILFSYSMLLLAFLIQVLYDRNFKCSNKLLFALAITSSVIANLRDNGLYVIILFTLSLIIIMYKKDKKSKMYLKLPVTILSICLAINLLNVVYNVRDNKKDALEAKNIHLLTYYYTQNLIDANDIDKINPIVDIKSAAQIYTPYFVDDIYNKIDHNKYKKNKSEMLELAINYSYNNKKLFIDYIFDSSVMVWRIDRPDNVIGGVFYTDITSKNNTKNIKHINKDKEFYQEIDKKINETLKNNKTYMLLYSPAIYMYMAIAFLLVMIVRYRQNIKLLMIYFPNFINILIVMVSTPLQDVRYLYPNFLILYFLLIIFVNYRYQIKQQLKEEVLHEK